MKNFKQVRESYLTEGLSKNITDKEVDKQFKSMRDPEAFYGDLDKARAEMKKSYNPSNSARPKVWTSLSYPVRDGDYYFAFIDKNQKKNMKYNQQMNDALKAAKVGGDKKSVDDMWLVVSNELRTYPKSLGWNDTMTREELYGAIQHLLGKIKEDVSEVAAIMTPAGIKIGKRKMAPKYLKNSVEESIEEKFKPYVDKNYPRCVDFYIQFRGGRGDRITSEENKKDFIKATDMVDAYCKKNKIKQKPVYSTPMEGSSAYKVGLMIDPKYSRTSDYKDGKDLQPLYVSLSKLKTAEDHGGGWDSLAEGEVDEKIKYRGNLKDLMASVKEYSDPSKSFPRDSEWKKLVRKHKRHIKALQDKGKDLPSDAEEDFVSWGMSNGEIKNSDDIERFIEDELLNASYVPEGEMNLKELRRKYNVISEKYRSKFKPSDIAKAVEIALAMGGAMTPAVNKIDKIKKGLSDDPVVRGALRTANEGVNDVR